MIRVSFGIYNTEEEVDYLLEVLPDAIKQAKKSNEENFNLAEPLY
jgi:cysteine sulfinate desulfinase/cysteine desulfurase-like protein